MRANPPPESLDALYLDVILKQLDRVLWRAGHEIGYFHREIGSLADQGELPENYRNAYARIVAMLASIERAVATAKRESVDLRDRLDLGLRACQSKPSGEVDEEHIAAARKAIDSINEAEDRLVRVVDSARNALQQHAEQGLIDWSMPFQIDFSVVLDAGPARRFYEACGENGEPLHIPCRPYCPPSGDADESEDWNYFRYRDGHPFQHARLGYLAHCILDHVRIPWQLLPYIKGIEVAVKFVDCETVQTAAAAKEKTPKF